MSFILHAKFEGDSRTSSIDFKNIVSNSIVRLQGYSADVNLLYCLERLVAFDSSSFFNEQDSNLGISYKNITECSLTTKLGTTSLVTGKRSASHWNLGDRAFCIRHVAGNRVRVTYTSKNGAETLPKFSDIFYGKTPIDPKMSARLCTLVCKVFDNSRILGTNSDGLLTYPTGGLQEFNDLYVVSQILYYLLFFKELGDTVDFGLILLPEHFDYTDALLWVLEMSKLSNINCYVATLGF